MFVGESIFELSIFVDKNFINKEIYRYAFYVNQRIEKMAKEYRPILEIPITPIEKTYDSISIGFVLGTVVLALWSFLNLPEIIPIHWNIRGEADGYGERYWIGFIPIISILFYYGNSKLTKIPHKYNYLKKLTKENVRSEYLSGRKLIRLTHLVSQIVFTLLTVFIIRGAASEVKDIGFGVVAALLLLMMAPIAYTVYNNLRGSSLIL